MFSTQYVGSSHDSRNHNESWMKIVDEQRFDFDHPRFHVGDEGIQCQKTALSPVQRRGNRVLTRAEKKFNKTLVSYRVKNEHAFGNLKGKFPIVLKEIRKDNLVNSQNTILATVVLYNILKSFEPQPPMPSQEAFDKLADFDRRMAFAPGEPLPNDDDNTFMRTRVIQKWFTEPQPEVEVDDDDDNE